MGGGTIGYAVARQATNGEIHLITSMNDPCLDFEFNEAWILSPVTTTNVDIHRDDPQVTEISNIKTYEEKYPHGRLKARWSAGIVWMRTAF